MKNLKLKPSYPYDMWIALSALAFSAFNYKNNFINRRSILPQNKEPFSFYPSFLIGFRKYLIGKLGKDIKIVKPRNSNEFVVNFPDYFSDNLLNKIKVYLSYDVLDNIKKFSNDSLTYRHSNYSKFLFKKKSEKILLTSLEESFSKVLNLTFSDFVLSENFKVNFKHIFEDTNLGSLSFIFRDLKAKNNPEVESLFKKIVRIYGLTKEDIDRIKERINYFQGESVIIPIRTHLDYFSAFLPEDTRSRFNLLTNADKKSLMEELMKEGSE